MPWIRTIAPGEATGLLKRLYDEAVARAGEQGERGEALVAAVRSDYRRRTRSTRRKGARGPVE